MKTASLLLAALVAAILPGCSNLERSRNLNDSRVAASTMAAQVCSNCHGLDGNSVSPNFPRLAAQPAPYVVAQLKEFRSHARLDPAGFVYMWGLSRHLTDEQIEGLAAYFAAQAPTPNAPGDARVADQGRGIFENGLTAAGVPACNTCHGPQGHGNATFPRLAGQHANYVVKQLAVFRDTEQRPEGAMMKAVSHSLAPQDMRAVAAYLQGLQ